LAGYSGTPLPKKLGIADGSRVALIGAPNGFQDQLTPLPEGVTFLPRPTGAVDVILFFTQRRTELARRFGALARKLVANGGFWIAWPKKSSGVDSDLTENVVREIGLANDLVDNKVCAVDEVWSGLRFVVPIARRPNWPERR
jgi:hypothetical protein